MPDMSTSPEAVIARLGQRLCAQGALDPQQLRRAERVAAQSGERLDHVLTRLGVVDERQVADGLAEVMGLPRIEPDAFPRTRFWTATLGDEALGARYLTSARLLPVDGGPDGLRLALADPLDRAAAEAVGLKLDLPVSIGVGLPTEIDAALERLFADDAINAEDVLTEAGDADTADDVARLRDLASGAPVIRLVDQIMRKAVDARASDIHVEPFERALRVRLRVDGTLREIDAPPNHLRAAVISRIKIMAKLNIAEQRLPQDGRIKIVVAGREIDIRVATAPSLHGEAVVMRLLDRSGLTLTFQGLGLDAEAEGALRPLIERPNGILLVTGPTGSGKTTTLYAAISALNGAERKIVTVEDPVEYQLPGVTQIQVKPQIGLTFAAGLRSILRLDPDVIMVGEIRDQETAEIAVQAALTGHLVIATLHTNSAAAAIDRLRDMGVEDYLISATLLGAAAQRLVRRVCPICAAAADPALARRVSPEDPPGVFAEPRGCADCRQVGYVGRDAVVEILTVDEEIRAAILARRDHREIEALATGRGMRTMRGHALEKARRRETSLTEIIRVVAEG